MERIPVIRLGKVKVRPEETGRLHIKKGTRSKKYKLKTVVGHNASMDSSERSQYAVLGRPPKEKAKSTGKTRDDSTVNTKKVTNRNKPCSTFKTGRKVIEQRETGKTSKNMSKSNLLKGESRKTKCPICSRKLQAKNYDKHLEEHSDNLLRYKCLELSCGAQFQQFSRMKAHFINKHKMFIVADGNGGYRVKAERGKIIEKSLSKEPTVAAAGKRQLSESTPAGLDLLPNQICGENANVQNVPSSNISNVNSLSSQNRISEQNEVQPRSITLAPERSSNTHKSSC